MGADPVDRRGLARLALVEELPPVCVPHGRAAVAEYEGGVTFSGTDEYHSPAVFWRGLGRRLGRRGYLPGVGGPEPQPDALLDVTFHMCRRCRFRVQVYQFLCLALIFAAICTLIGGLAAAQQGATELAKYFAFAFLPGWIPGGLLVIVALFTKARPRWRVRRTPDRRHIAVRAHPRFAEAIRPTPTAERKR
ncbi:hypothetical protein [Nocardia mangyaensis]|uniref:hypothetical protein n=1 Tax=Nocardia mangyaensis TaxID=2213200 RepID=UPI0026748069|nr:hypothetical protein [Nocardia mangyaensis]MDO3647612.1 hypothetical protein [Nocardia mangyaensis]